MKTSELTGPALDQMVRRLVNNDDALRSALGIFVADSRFRPSTNWAQGGSIIEREKIDCIADPNGKDVWMGQLYAARLAGNKVVRAYGPTPLIAAMRCYVASKLGDEVDVPEELI